MVIKVQRFKALKIDNDIIKVDLVVCDFGLALIFDEPSTNQQKV